MKTELVLNKDRASKVPPFPFLAQSTHENPEHSFTVLFVGPNSGTVVHRASESAAWKVGDFHQGFTSVYRADHWRVLSRSEHIILKND